MKTPKLTIPLLAFASLFCTITAQGTIIYQNDFDTDGTLTTTYPEWANNASGSGDMAVSGSAITLGATSEDLYFNLASPTAPSELFWSIKLTPNTMPTATGLGGYFVALGDGTSFDSRIFIATGTDTNKVVFGISHGTTIGSAIFDTTEYTLGSSLTIVGRYVADPDLTEFWINPSSGDVGSPLLSTSATSTGTVIDRFTLRQGDKLDIGESSIALDQITFGTSFTDVVLIPEAGSASLLALGFLLLTGFRRLRN